MNSACIAGVIAAVVLLSRAPAALVTFSYNQTDSVAGSGTISAFSYDDGGGPINFAAMPMPSPTLLNPAPGLTPAGFVGAQTVQTGNSNEGNVAVGLLWSGSVTAIGTRGADVFSIQIPLLFVPKQVQSPSDTHDYTWSVVHGDGGPGVDDVSGTGFRFAMYFGRDTTADGAETADTFQRYTQQTLAFTAGVLDSFTNTHTSSGALKDATDSGAPAGTDAAGRDLAFYWAWRDGGTLPANTAMLVNDFSVGGLLNADESTLTLIPEPASPLLALAAAALFVRRRRR
jgi:hypothetical protein